ncbi:MAG: FG-GAP repeat protein [Herpetosiphonaceae bacterium]|nr:FG-GAP repeat protein [Herpetosiphonaceae bacterium]
MAQRQQDDQAWRAERNRLRSALTATVVTRAWHAILIITDNSAEGAGAAYGFTRSGAQGAPAWFPQAYLKASNTGTDDRFGFSVAVDGDTVVVGAYGEASAATGVGGNQADNSAIDAGAAYVFTQSGATWTQQAYLKASNTNVLDGFGESVAVSGATVVVGAPWEQSAATGVGGNQADNSTTWAGAAYVFTMYPNASDSTTEPVRQSGQSGIITTFETPDSPKIISIWYQALLTARGWPAAHIDAYSGAAEIDTYSGDYVIAYNYSGCPGKHVKITFESGSMEKTRVTVDNRLHPCYPTVTP